MKGFPCRFGAPRPGWWHGNGLLRSPRPVTVRQSLRPLQVIVDETSTACEFTGATALGAPRVVGVSSLQYERRRSGPPGAPTVGLHVASHAPPPSWRLPRVSGGDSAPDTFWREITWVTAGAQPSEEEPRAEPSREPAVHDSVLATLLKPGCAKGQGCILA